MNSVSHSAYHIVIPARYASERLPGKVLRVHYEHVVSDLEGQVRRILDYLELPFEQGCLEFHQTKRSVRTPSSEQVRQPIYQSGLEQWRNFEPYLNVLTEELAEEVADYPDFAGDTA